MTEGQNGLHLLYEGIQKQLSRTPLSRKELQIDEEEPLDEKTGEFIVKGWFLLDFVVKSHDYFKKDS